MVASPHVGDRVAFHGEANGAPVTLTIDVGSPEPIQDRSAHRVSAVRVWLNETEGDLHLPWILWVDPSAGRLVAAADTCAVPDLRSGACDDWTNVDFYLAGYPWALGASSFQGQVLTPGAAIRAAFPTQPSPTTITYQVGPKEHLLGHDAYRLSPGTSAILPGFAAMGFVNASFWIDPRIPFPVQIEVEKDSKPFIQLALDSFVPGTGEVIAPSAPLTPPQALAQLSSRPPLRGLSAEDPDVFSFPERDAVRLAEENDSGLQAFLAAHPSARLVDATWYRNGGSSTGPVPGLQSDATAVWRLAYGEPGGAGYQLNVKRTTSQARVLPSQTTGTTEGGAPRSPPPHVLDGSAPERLDTISSAVPVLESFHVYPDWRFVDATVYARGGVVWNDQRFDVRLLYDTGTPSPRVPALSLDARLGTLDLFDGPRAQASALLGTSLG